MAKNTPTPLPPAKESPIYSRLPWLGAAAFLLGTGAAAWGVLSLATAPEAVRDPGAKGRKRAFAPACLRLEAAAPADAAELAAADLLRTAWTQSGKERENTLLALQRQYPTSQAMRTAYPEYELLPSIQAAREAARQKERQNARDAQSQKRFTQNLEENDPRKRLDLMRRLANEMPQTSGAAKARQYLDDAAAQEKKNQEAARRNAEAQKQLAAAQAAAQPLPLMEKIIREFPDTVAAAKARDFIATHRRQQQKAAFEAQQRERDLPHFLPEFQDFLPGYRNALAQNDYAQAHKLLEQWQKKSHNSISRKMIACCREDLRGLEQFRRVIGSYMTENRNRWITVYGQKGEKDKFRIRIRRYDPKDMEILFDNEFHRTPEKKVMDYLHLDCLLSIYEEKHEEGQPSREALRWLIHYARSETVRARDAWKNFQDKDPRREYHALLLEHSN